MKNIIGQSKMVAVVILILMHAPILKAQVVLTQLNPNPHSDLINDIYLHDSLHIYIVGALGKIAYSTDGGMNWAFQYQNVNRTLKSIAFADNNTGICIGDSGFILRTTNAGSSWSSVSSGTNYNLNEVYFKNSTTGYIVGNNGIILYTTDAGQTWTPQTSGTSFNLFAIRISVTNKGYIAGGGGTILHTINGTSWTYATNAGSYNQFEVYQINDSTVIVGGINGIMKTTNNGTTWTTNYSQTDDYIMDIDFINGTDTGFAVGNEYANAIILKTTNGGNSWSRIETLTSKQIYCNQSLNTHNVWIAGAYGNIWKSGNLGTTFSYVPQGIRDNLNSVFFPSVNIGYAVGENGTLIKTTDAGNHWISKSTGFTSSIKDVYFFDDSTGIAVGSQSTVLKIYHGGDSITQSSFGYTGFGASLMNVVFVNRDTGFISPSHMNILRTTDGGLSWHPMNLGVLMASYAISFPDKLTGYTGGYSSKLLKTTDCGVTWNTMINTGSDIFAADFITANNGIITQGGSVKITTNGGSTWNSVNGITNGVPSSLKYIDFNNVYGVCAYGKVVLSHNGGSNWSYTNRLTECDLNKLCFAPSGVGYIVGDHGTIIRLDDSILVSDGDLNNDKESGISLFPNPTINNFTTKFKIAERSLVVITVYDFYGRLAYKKQCGILNPGVYEYLIDLNSNTSGVFIVKIDFEHSSTTAKIVISK